MEEESLDQSMPWKLGVFFWYLERFDEPGVGGLMIREEGGLAPATRPQGPPRRCHDHERMENTK